LPIQGGHIPVHHARKKRILIAVSCVSAQGNCAGRGKINENQLEKVKEILLKKRPNGVKINEIAEYVGCTRSRALRLLDVLSKDNDFLVYMEGEHKATRFFYYQG
jgi:hypothetical protein